MVLFQPLMRARASESQRMADIITGSGTYTYIYVTYMGHDMILRSTVAGACLI